MPAPRPLTVREVLAARHALARRLPDADATFRALLARPATRPRALGEWHDLLLFVLAHPHTSDATALATQALEAVGASAAAMVASAEDSLTGSGIVGTPVSATLSLPLVTWLVETHPGRVGVASCDADAEVVRDVLRVVLPPEERECVDLLTHLDGGALLAATFGDAPAPQLERLLATLAARVPHAALAAHLFASLRLAVRLYDRAIARTWLRAPADAPWWSAGPLRRAVDVAAVCRAPAPRPVRLTARAAEALVAAARRQLAVLERETDPITFAGAVALFDCGDGLRIALQALAAAHRLPFDSYVGFMAFRNGVPLAYGGAWIVPGRSKIGINVFDAMRGGESAWFFAQLLRVYHHAYDVRVFEVENYQLGHGNAEGMRSGAFWFYYRLGFRPVDAMLVREAEHAFAGLRRTPPRAVPRSVLRRLVAAGLELSLGPDPVPPLDTAALTLAVQRHVVRTHAGDRARAAAHAERRLRRLLPMGPPGRWHAAEHGALARWSTALDAIPDLETWSARERRDLVRVLRAKAGADERLHQRLFRRHTRLLAAWRRISESA
jgi:hypothetical protein